VAHGQKLFAVNCSHCHADDATGDEGPDLHGLTKSDERIKAIITNGIKGEMPAFGKKLQEADKEALVGFLRSLR
jgi:mono/diheme cytochrome c family protein